MSRMFRVVDDAAAAPSEKPLRIAVATNDLENLDAHFGSARKLAIYEVWRTGARFVAAHEFGVFTAGQGRHDDAEDRIAPKIEALEGCALLFALAIGGPSAAKAVRAGVHPIKRKAPEPIADVLAQVREMLNGAPPPFLRKILGTQPKPDFTDDEEIDG